MFLLLVITGKLLSLQESQWLNTEHLLQATLHLTMKKKNLPGVYVSGLIIQDKICARWIYLGYLIKYQIQREVGYFIERESISGGKKGVHLAIWDKSSLNRKGSALQTWEQLQGAQVMNEIQSHWPLTDTKSEPELNCPAREQPAS